MIGLFVLVLLRIWRIAHLSKDLLGTYICAGVFTMILWQVFQNVAMTIGLMPVTGLPLPFISYGGSGLVDVLRDDRPGPERPHAPLPLSGPTAARVALRRRVAERPGRATDDSR